MVDALADEGAQYVRFAQPSSKCTNVPASTSQSASPSISEFKTFLGEREVKLQKQTINKGSDKFVVYERPANVSNNEWWESVLTSEKERLEADKHSKTVDVADILPDEASSDDDIPIVSTLPSAKLSKPKRKGKQKGQLKWTYETFRSQQGQHQNTGMQQMHLRSGRRNALERKNWLLSRQQKPTQKVVYKYLRCD
jgi:hypothetical protein